MLNHELDERPDRELIERHSSHLQELWRTTHDKWKDVYDAYYFRTFDIWDKKKENAERPEWLRPARPTSIVNNAVDHQLASDPKVHRFPVGDSETHISNANLVELGLTALLNEIALLEPNLTWKMLGKHLIHYGYAVCEVGLDSKTLTKRNTEPEREAGETDTEFQRRVHKHQQYRRNGIPFRIRAPHPGDVLLDPLEKRPTLAIKHTKRYAIDLHNLTKTRKARGRDADIFELGENPWELILADECWTENWHGLMVPGKLLFVEANTWGFVPYGHAFAGFGMEPTGERDPTHLAVGILDPVTPDIRAQAQAISARHNVAMDASFNKILVRGMGADEVRDQLDEGEFVEVPDEGAIRRMELPQYPRWMFETEEWYARDIEEGTVSRALSGIREQGVSTVGQQAILSTAAGRKFVGVAKQLEHLAMVASSQILELIDSQDFDLTIRGKRLNAAMIEHDYTVQITFDLVDPVLALQERQTGMAEVKLGLKSDETYRNADARIEDETGERKRLLLQEIRKNPLVHQILAMDAAKEAGIDRLLERALQLAEGQSSSNGAGAGAEAQALLGPDGQPLEQSMGQTGGAPRAVEQLRQGLTPDIMSPGRTGANLAG